MAFWNRKKKRKAAEDQYGGLFSPTVVPGTDYASSGSILVPLAQDEQPSDQDQDCEPQPEQESFSGPPEVTYDSPSDSSDSYDSGSSYDSGDSGSGGSDGGGGGCD